jgi:hypothetical protein
MTDATITAQFIDPVYSQIAQQVNGCSDQYPVLLLPVRLETCFKNTTRFVTIPDTNATRITALLNLVFELVYEARTWMITIEQKTEDQVARKIEEIDKKAEIILKATEKITEISGTDRVILREAATDLKTELAEFDVVKRGVVRTAYKSLTNTMIKWESVIEAIAKTYISPTEKGREMLDRLGALENEIQRVYVARSVNAQSLQGGLVHIDLQMQAINSLIDVPDFLATKAQIQAIQQKISAIKRSQKNSTVRLMDYKTGFTGTYNLTEKEYKLRGEINDLKVRIDEDYVPYMQLLHDLKRFPVRHLTYYIDKASTFLKASNKVGYKTVAILLEQKNWLYKQLSRIRNRAHRPLEGSIHEIYALKNEYKILNDQIIEFIGHAQKIKTINSVEKTAVSRLQTHLEKEYLEDLKHLLPGERSIESQSFSNQKVRHTATNTQRTIDLIYNLNQAVKHNNLNREAALIQLNAGLDDLKKELKISTTNSILLPRTMYHATRNEFNSLKSQIQNFYNKLNVSNNHPQRAIISQQLAEIEPLLTDQFTDVFNERDPFYDEYRKRITFLVRSETVKELWVRIYPDDIAIDNHDERISDVEEKTGQDYYKAVYSLPTSQREEAKLPAFRAAAASIGARRAAYVIGKLLPPQVITNSIPNPTNNLTGVVDVLDTIYNLEGNTVTASETNATNSFIINLPATLQNMLAPANFNPCARTKPTLDIAMKYISAGFAFQEQQLSKPGAYPPAIEKNKCESLKLAYSFLYQYYADHTELLNLPFDPLLSFPQVEKKSKTWDRAGVTNVMPDRFVVVTKRGDNYRQVVAGKPVRKNLQLSIDPSANQSESFYHENNGDLHLPEEMLWMFDFDAAVEAGMGIRVPLQDEDFSQGFDFVMAFGMQAHADLPHEERHLAGQDSINNLFLNHLYTEGGMEYLPVGTATNNTDAVKSPYHSLDDDWDGIFNLYVKSEIPHGIHSYNISHELEITDGQFFKDALGLPTAIAALIRHHQKKDIANGRAMNRALYGITLKYYMQVMLKGLVNNNDIFHTLPFLMNHVSAVGNLPSFRIDKQPYGIVPITLLDKYWANTDTAKGSEGSYLKNLSLFLKATRDIFKPLAHQKVQTINSPGYDGDPQKVFLEILGLEPYSKEFFYRAGANITSRWGSIEDDNFDFQINWHAQDPGSPWAIANQYSYLLSQVGHKSSATRTTAVTKSAAYKNRYTNGNNILGHIIQDPALGTEFLHKDNTEKNYLEVLADLSANKASLLLMQRTGANSKYVNTLLFNLVRGSLMNDNSANAVRAVRHLAALDIASLERLLANHIDLCSYRLDAWISGLASHRLLELRHSAGGGSGAFLGAFGFVEKLKQAPARVRIEHLPDGLSPNDGSEVFTAPDNQGFIHGPNLNHAITAAVLRAGFNSQKQKAAPGDNAFAINLSSARVRKALNLLEGVSQGQEVGALLGYMFERALHEKYKDANGDYLEMNSFIYPLRRKFPTFREIDKGVSPALSTEQKENLKASNVVDGLEMLDYFEAKLKTLNLWSDDKSFVEMMIVQNGNNLSFNGYPWGLETGKNQSQPYREIPPDDNALNLLKIKAIIYELDNMADAIDAMGDLVTAEGVYQLVRGNHTRAGAVLNAMSEGRVPTDPEIIKSMREGNMVTQRLVLGVAPVTGSQSPWPGIPQSPRGLAEPSLNHWLATQIGDPDAIDWLAEYGNTQTYISLSDLEMQPIDIVLLAMTGGDEATRELEQRCADYLRTNVSTTGTEIKINFNVKSPAAIASFGEMISLFRHLGKIIAKARIADARDFRISEDAANFGNTSPAIDTADLQLRLTDALIAYKNLLLSLSVFSVAKTVYSPAEIALAIAKLKELSGWDFAAFYPTDEDAENIAGMVARINSAKEKMTQNIVLAEQVLLQLPLEADQTKWLSAIEDLAKKLFGASFKLVPKISLSNHSEINNQLVEPLAAGLLRHLPEDGLEEWFSGAALVRKPVSVFESTRMLTEVLYGQKENLRVAQLPYQVPENSANREYWLGAEYPESFEPDGDRLSLVVAGYLSQPGGQICALMIDEWMEIIPGKKQTTGIALHYNQPDARAPQALLLAVTPKVTGQWSIHDVGLIVEEAYNLAKLRAVEPEHVDFSVLSQLLPATANLFGGDGSEVRSLFGFGASQNSGMNVFVNHSHLNDGFEPELIAE